MPAALRLLAIALLAVSIRPAKAQAPAVDGDALGIWYMYFYQARFGEGPWGLQGDFQFRNWDAPGGDLEQLLLRSGLTYTPDDVAGTFTLGYASITTGQYGGEFDGTVHENRIYQEALLPHGLAERILLTHRFRYEQRFNEGQDFRTRFRYNLFVNVPFNGEGGGLGKGIWYGASYNEIFVNGERDIGDGRAVQYFDRNRTYLALGYGLTPKLRVQAGWMRQTTVDWAKNQLQLSLHQNWAW